MNIATMRFSALGDLAMTIPAIRSLKQKPLMVTTALGQQVLADEVDDFILLKNKQFTEVVKLIQEIRRSEVDVLVDFQDSDRSKVIRLFSNKKVIHPGKVDRRRTHNCATEIFLDMAIHQTGGRPYDYTFSPKEKSYIVLHPGSSEKWESKRLPVKKWQEFGKVLWERYSLSFMITGTESEKDYCESVKKVLAGRSYNMAGKFSISELRSLLDHAFLTVSTDSGPMHLSAVLKTPTIGIFGATNWKYFAPFGPWSVALHDEVFFKSQLPPLKNLTCTDGAYDNICLEPALAQLAPYLEGTRNGVSAVTA
ncbi:MAG: glycosyltransferase family 9 protein [Pseudomonadales bacterium]|nr:glycosyltransferase family 9 protein [Pseudomonadales bacterium]